MKNNTSPSNIKESFCPKCGTQVQSRFLITNNFLYLQRRCGNHIKENEVLHKIDEILPHYIWNSNIKNLMDRENPWKGTKAVDVLITRKCHWKCKVCYIKYGRENYEEMSIDNFKKILKVLNGAKVVLNGGEVTLRNDLEDFIKLTLESGNIPVVYTNGLRFSSRSYVKKLKRAGLKEVVITFDGFKGEIYEKLRSGKHELKLVMKALENLKKENVKTSIYSTIVKGINDDQIPYILRYMASNKFIWTVSFKPVYLPGASKTLRLTEENIPSYSELIELIGREVKGITTSYILQLRKLLESIQYSFAKSSNPIYFTWLEVPTIFVKRKGNKLKPLFPQSLLSLILPYVKKLNRVATLPSIFSHNSEGIFKLEEYLFRRGIGKIVLGTIAPNVSPYISSAPTLKQLKGRVILSSYLAW